MYGLIRGINKFLKSGMYDYCNIETNDPEDESKTSFVTKDGGMCTVFRIDGAFSLVGEQRFKNNMEQCLNALSGALKKPGFKLQFVFSRDPDGSRRQVDQSINPLKKTIRDLELEFDDLFEERADLMSKKTSAERCYLVVSTLPGILDSKTHKTALKSRIDAVKDFNIGIKPGEFSQSPFYAVGALRQIHQGFVNSISNALGNICHLKPLSVHDALRVIRMEINMEMTSDEWRPSMLGDKISPTLMKESGRRSDLSHVMNPSVAFQLFNQRPEVNQQDSSLVNLGDKIIAPVLVDIPPQETMPFSDLFDKINDDVPWRWTLTLETGHKQVLGKISTKNSFATFLAMFSGDNKLIKDAAAELLELAREGESLIMAQMSFCTWGNSLEETNRRKQVMAQAAQNWGNMDLIEEFGDPISAWMDTIPAMSAKPISTPFPLPMMDALTMFPVTRPASPWETGSVQFRTMDNKLFPYMPGSSDQTAWFDLIFAPPGFGKSFFLSAANMALITNPGNRVLPRIAIIDIGFSSAAFVNLIKSALPESKKYLAQAFKLEMTKDFSINPFDTPLGCQYPLAVDKDFQSNLLTLLLTPAGSDSIPRLPEVCGKIIDSMYEYFNEDNNPNPYDSNRDSKVDELLLNLNIEIENDDEITWWDVSKLLFNKGYPLEASLAQRYAVPTLSDATTVLSEATNIKDVFGEAQINGEPLLKFIEGMLTTVISDYPILTGPSVFDIGSARICSMDLSSVAKGGSAQGNKRVGVMYMLARQVMCKDFYRNEDILDEIPVHFRDYHAKIIEADAGVPKKLCMDEFHRTTSCEQVRLQAEQDIREGRKFNVHIALLSQMVDDFDDSMIELANNIFILSKGNAEETVNKIKAKFKPTSDGIRALKFYVTGPGPEGSSMLYLANIKGGKNVEQVLRLTLGPIEKWAYSTTHEDVRLRARLSKEVGLNNSLKILAKEFPGGGAKDYITAKAANSDVLSDDGENILDIIKNELIQKYKQILNVA